MPGSKQVDVQKKIDVIHRLLLSGARRRDILKYVEKEGWQIKTRQIDKYIALARDEIAEVAQVERKMAFGMATKRLDNLYYRSLIINDNKTALAVQKEINALFGLNTTRVEQTVEISESESVRRILDAAISSDPSARERIAAALRAGEEEEGQ